MYRKDIQLKLKKVTAVLSFYFITALLASGQCPEGIQNYWTFNNDNSGSTYDTIGTLNGNIGVLPVSSPEGIVGKARNFGGSTYIEFPNYPDYFWETSLSVAVWCRFNGIPDDFMVILGYDRTGSTHWWIGIEALSGRPVFYLYDNIRSGGGIVGTQAIGNNEWHFLVATYENSTTQLKLYVDGELAVETTRSYSEDFYADDDLCMGSLYKDAAWQFYYTGQLDEAALFNRDLTPDEIDFYYQKGLRGYGYCAEYYEEPVFTSDPVTIMGIDEAYSYNVECTGFPVPEVNLTEHPAGMSYNESTGEITWLPATGGLIDVTIEATNPGGTATQEFTIQVFDPCLDSMVSYFNLNEGSGISVSDTAGYRVVQTSGSPSWTEGVVGSALSFNGSSQYFSVPDHADFDWPAESDFTIELWCNINEAKESLQVMFSRETPGETHWWIGLNQSSANVAFYLYDAFRQGGGFVSTQTLTTDKWHHLVAVHKGATGTNTLFIDGKPDTAVSYSYYTDFNSSADLQVANFYSEDTHQYYFDGMLDEIAVYRRAITDEEAWQHYVQGSLGYNYCADMQIVPVFQSEPVDYAFIDTKYEYTAVALGVPEPTYTLVASPAGMTINSETGLIDWTPDNLGNYNVIISAINSEGDDAQMFTINVIEPCIDDIICYLKLEEIKDNIINDEFSFRKGQTIGGPANVTGQVGNALYFNGLNQYASLPDDDVFDWSAGSGFTVELWCKPGEIDDNPQVMIGRDEAESTHWWLGSEAGTGHATFYLYDETRTGGGLTSNIDIHDGEWHHLAAVYDPDAHKVYLYVDGWINRTANRIYENGFSSAAAIQIANFFTQGAHKYFYEGSLDEIAVYGRVLSSEEIHSHYIYGLSGDDYCDAADIGPLIIDAPFTAEK